MPLVYRRYTFYTVFRAPVPFEEICYLQASYGLLPWYPGFRTMVQSVQWCGHSHNLVKPYLLLLTDFPS